MNGTLYLVPTPLGDERDLSPRAIETLSKVDLIAAEDTRLAARLLQSLNIGKRLVSYFDHNEKERAPEVVAALQSGQNVALISDAGTPLVSDPGYRLVQAALAAGLPVVGLPGPCAAVTALVVSGLPTDRFTFAGFLPRDAGPRKAALAELRARPETLIFYEPPHRLVEMLRDVREVLGERRVALAFNLSKQYEHVERGTPSELLVRLEAEERVLGEITVVIEGAAAASDAEDWSRAIALARRLLDAGLEPRAVRDVVAETLELPKRAVYQRVLELVKRDE